MPWEPEVGCDVDNSRCKRASAALERVFANRVEDDFVRLAVRREGFSHVVDPCTGTKQSKTAFRTPSFSTKRKQISAHPKSRKAW